MNHHIRFILFLLPVIPSVHAQEWCKDREPADLQRPPSTFDNKLISDRFNHTVHPDIVNFRSVQLEVVTLLRNELRENERWVNDPDYYPYNIYNSYAIRYSFRKDLEVNLSYTELILKGDTAVRNYSKSNANTGLSFGAKYAFYHPAHKSVRISIFGQLTIPKAEYIFKTYLSPEIRVLLSHAFMKHFDLTYNLGTSYSNKLGKMVLLYAINLKLHAGKRVDVFTEFYQNYTKTGPPRTPHKRGLIGLGFYFLENLYIYSSIEAGWYHEDSLNSERFDMGLSYRLNY